MIFPLKMNGTTHLDSGVLLQSVQCNVLIKNNTAIHWRGKDPENKAFAYKTIVKYIVTNHRQYNTHRERSRRKEWNNM